MLNTQSQNSEVVSNRSGVQSKSKSSVKSVYEKSAELWNDKFGTNNNFFWDSQELHSLAAAGWNPSYDDRF